MKNKYDEKTNFWFSNTTKRNKTYIVTFERLKVKILVVLTERWVLNNTNNNNKKRMNTINKKFYKPWKH